MCSTSVLQPLVPSIFYLYSADPFVLSVGQVVRICRGHLAPRQHGHPHERGPPEVRRFRQVRNPATKDTRPGIAASPTPPLRADLLRPKPAPAQRRPRRVAAEGHV